MLTRILFPEEYSMALELAWQVFERFEAPEYSEEGIENFAKTIRDPAFLALLCYYGAFEDNKLVGMLATRSEGAHIALFFVREAYHRRGVGRSLFTLMLSDAKADTITVNSSPYAVAVYNRLGFVAAMPEQVRDGIRYTPMVYPKPVC
ncbi:MAG: GNAT family N-acetyltransferase [Eubacteriales bacterium]|nr:GNAT family N-acetyltransferase [Eubacteriales bacterium]